MVTGILVAANAVLSVWLPYHREQEIILKIEACEGGASSETYCPQWLRRVVGDERLAVFNRVQSVDLKNCTISIRPDLGLLRQLNRIEVLDLHGTAVSGAANGSPGRT